MDNIHVEYTLNVMAPYYTGNDTVNDSVVLICTVINYAKIINSLRYNYCIGPIEDNIHNYTYYISTMLINSFKREIKCTLPVIIISLWFLYIQLSNVHTVQSTLIQWDKVDKSRFMCSSHHKMH